MALGSAWLDYVTSVGTLLASVSALAAVAITLYLNIWRENRRRPSLTLEFSSEAHRGAAYSWNDEGGPTVVAPLNVTNQVGKKSARKVEVLLSAGYWLGISDASRGHGPARFYELIHQDPLTWWVSDPHQGEGKPVADIPPGVTRKVVILQSGHSGSLYRALTPSEGWRDEHAESFARSYLGLFAVVPLSRATAIWLNNQLAYEIRLTVVAEDIDAVSYRTRLRWAGPTFDELRNDSHEYVQIHPAWDPMERIDAEAWPGSAPSDARGWVVGD